MKNLKNKFIIALLAIIGVTTFSSCKKECDVCETGECFTIQLDNSNKHVFAKFVIPEGTSVSQITFSGTLYDYDTDADANRITIKALTINGTAIVGNYRDFDPDATRVAGEPVPGAEIIIEQEPNDDPVATSTSDRNGNFTITIRNPGPGNYVITCSAISSKGGFAVGGYNAT